MKYLILLAVSILGFGFTNPLDKNPIDLSTKHAALEVLQTNCNSCHKTDNPFRVFTEENMNSYSKKINRQVFVWRRMPKGKENNLKEIEAQILKDWLNNLQ